MKQVVIGILKKNNKYLIGQIKSHRKHAGKWEFPGGKLESGETLEKALIREFKEEFNINIEVGQLILECDYKIDEYHLNFIKINNYTGNILCLEHDKLKWASIEDLYSYDLIDTFMLDAIKNV